MWPAQRSHIDVLAPYTQDLWQIEVQNVMFDGVKAIKFWHICYGSVDGQRDVFDVSNGMDAPTRNNINVPK